MLNKTKALLYTLSALLLLGSCRTMQETTETNEVTATEEYARLLEKELDSLYTYASQTDSSYTEITPGLDQEVEIENPCDSLTGLLKDMQLKSEGLSIEAKNGKLTIISQCEDAITSYRLITDRQKEHLSQLIETNDSLLKASVKTTAVKSETVITKWWSWPPFYIGLAVWPLVWLIKLIIKILK